MKKILFAFAACIAVGMGFTSCKKPANYYCWDAYADSNGNILIIESTRTEHYFKDQAAMSAYATPRQKQCVPR